MVVPVLRFLPEALRHVLIPALIGGLIGLAVMTLTRAFDGAATARPGFAAAVARAAPGVVNIYSTKHVRPAICQQPRFREWCNRFAGEAQRQMQRSLGSGVIAHPAGYILTNNHVIDGADEILVGFSDGATATGELVGTDPETDLAVIRVRRAELTPIPLGESDQIAVGDVALAIGNPFGIGQTVSAGIISAKGRVGISTSPYEDFIQTDAAINPGNSGGPLIDAEGRLIGINTLIFSRSGESAGIGFAIPARLAYMILTEIIEKGRVIRGWLGVDLASSPGADSSPGLLVTGVDPAGPAARAGILRNDLITAVNGQPAVNSIVISRLIAAINPGGEMIVEVSRNGRELTFSAIAGERP
ncbi:MAG: trypsin-like peptidase domain-containing protein [Pseudomonadales bacterium]